jgi:FKBP-type peptidyl-prolyl cis-trans isomerase
MTNVIGRTVGIKYSLSVLSNGTLTQMSTFSSSTIQSTYYNLPLAWQIVLPQVPVGSYITLYVPSSLGYGSNYYNGVAANSILVYKIKLVSVS